MEVKIYLNDLKYRYEVYQLFNVYFSMSNIDFIEEDKSDYKVYVCLLYTSIKMNMK